MRVAFVQCQVQNRKKRHGKGVLGAREVRGAPLAFLSHLKLPRPENSLSLPFQTPATQANLPRMPKAHQFCGVCFF